MKSNILLILLISISIPLFLSIILYPNLIYYYVIFPLIFIPFSLISYEIINKTKFKEIYLKRYVKYSYENPYKRKRELIENALKGSNIARITVGEIIKEALERKYGSRLYLDNAKKFINDEDVIAVIFYQEYENYFKDLDKYRNALSKAVELAW
jgi:hypothetical protein